MTFGSLFAGGRMFDDGETCGPSRLWPTPSTSPTRPNEGNVRLLRAKVLAGELTESEAMATLNGKSPMESQGKIGPATSSAAASLGSERWAEAHAWAVFGKKAAVFLTQILPHLKLKLEQARVAEYIGRRKMGG